ncbi:MAG: AI-2E family transporter [Patescibacteria group bacterium]|nr:AI-2E family transporter [Patescibacteria group bacterium]
MNDRVISISAGTIFKGLLIIVLVYALWYLRDIVLVVLAAVVIASAIEPATQWCIRHRIHRIVAVVFMYVVLGILLSAFVIFFVPQLVGEAVNYLSTVPDTINVSDLWQPLQAMLSSSTASTTVQTISLHDLAVNLQQYVSGTTTGAFQTATIIFGGAFSFLLIVILSFYLSVQEDGVVNFLRIITPVTNHEYIVGLWRRSRRKIGLWLQGQLLLCLIIGVLVYLGLLILHLPHPLLLAVLAGTFELIPVFGPIMSSIPAIITAFASGGITLTLLVVGLYIIIYQFESNLIYPLVVRKIVGISPILVILALVIGAKLAGVIGAILAVPLSAAFMEFVADIEKRKHIGEEVVKS